MKIFISHSLPRSRELAKQVEWFLRQLFPSTVPWISTGIDKGADSIHEIGQSLQDAAVGVVCLTRENLDERWILFESGALAKQLDNKVCTLLLDVEKADVKPPLSKFQHTTAERDEMLEMTRSINKVAVADGKGRIDADLEEAFNLFWPKLEATITTLRTQGPPAATAAPERSAEDMMAEVLSTIRDLASQSEVMFARQGKMLLLAKEQYEEALGVEAPVLRTLRSRVRSQVNWGQQRLALPDDLGAIASLARTIEDYLKSAKAPVDEPEKPVDEEEP